MRPACLFVFLLFATFLSLCLSDKITNLPGYVGPELSMYSGYITVSSNHNLFYWLIEAESNPDTAPLVLWLNGGPGCSSLGGLFQENGPLRVVSESEVQYTNLGWTRFANMLFLEAPAGVGFSYIPDTKVYHTDDAKTALDNYHFLQQFLVEFPQYEGRDLWITGESYAGVYIPTLAENIVSNKSSPLYSMLKGLSLGNPEFRCGAARSPLQFNTLYWHGLVSYDNYQRWTDKNCNSFSDLSAADQLACDSILLEARSQVGEISQELAIVNPSLSNGAPAPQDKKQPSLDPDDLYQDFCTDNGTLEFSDDQSKNCSNDYLTIYLNKADVQSAIHAQSTIWSTCSDNIAYSQNAGSMVPYYQKIFSQAPSVDVLIYSGDIDILTVPFAYTHPCIYQLSSTATSRWGPWFVNGATAGYVQSFPTFTYATVKGAGHEAPAYQPLNSYNMFYRFHTQGNLTDLSANATDINTLASAVRSTGHLSQGSVLRSIRGE